MGGRIEYIDALRGFTMLLVVIVHTSSYGLGLTNSSDIISYHSVLLQFIMPLFFFVSGFLLYKANCEWTASQTITFVKRKVNALILSPFIFMCAFTLYMKVNLFVYLTDNYKGGYWFTFTLFTFYLIYITLQQLLKLFRIKGYWRDILLLIMAAGVYVIAAFSLYRLLPINESFFSTLSVGTWSYFIYLILGTRVKKYFYQFEKCLDKSPLVMVCIMSFFGANLLSSYIPFIVGLGTLLSTMKAITGIVIVFAFFRSKSALLTKDKTIGQVFQYVGRRTLDIYLIHYFFICTNMQVVLPEFSKLNSPFLEFMVSLFIGILVVAACLLISNVLRLSPRLAHFLFGAKVMPVRDEASLIK